MHYYTYAYLREDRTPYYIGKGQGNRIYEKRKGLKPPKDKSRIIYLKQNLTEEEAFKHEIYMIDVFGRKDLGTGILHNRTYGGEGPSGAIRSDETRRKMSEAQKGNTKMLGKTHSEETRKKIGEASKGKTPSEESRRKMSNAAKGKILSDETKRKMSEAKKDKILSEEHRRKIGEASKGKTHSEETKIKMSEAKKNISEETRRKMSESSKGTKWWNDGCGNCKMMIECPGDGWKPGRK